MKYLLRKGGYYYKPEARGYTEFASRAGLFDETYAKESEVMSHGDVTAVPVSEISDYTIEELKFTIKNCHEILAAIAECKI